MTDTAVSRRYEWRNKIIRLIFSFFIAIGVIVNTVAPFSIVNASTVDIKDFSIGKFYVPYSDQYQYEVTAFEGTDIKCHTFSFSNYSESMTGFSGRCQLVMSRNPFTLSVEEGNLSSLRNLTIEGAYDSTNHLYYKSIVTYAGSPYTVQYAGNAWVPNGNYTYYQDGYDESYSEMVEYFNINYPDSIDYGEIQDLQYSTNIVGSGTTTGDSNIDTISWYPYWDTNSNISTTWNMEIQVVPGTWQGGTNTDIFSQTYQNFIINESGAMSIYHGTYLKGSLSISWGEVKNKLSILSWADLFQYFDGTYWNKKGWVYRARFNDPDNGYWSEWQTVYTVTSSAGEGVEKYIDPDDGTGLPGFYQDVEDSFNTTSVVNNNTNVTHIYTGIPMTVNIDDTETSEDITKIKKYVKQIRDILINLNTENSTTENNQNDQEITNNLNSVVGDLHITEDEFMTDMDEKLNDIDRNVELLNDNKFIAAANWVRLQYDYLVSDTPFELLIVFGLVLSLALIIIGKIR